MGGEKKKGLHSKNVNIANESDPRSQNILPAKRA